MQTEMIVMTAATTTVIRTMVGRNEKGRNQKNHKTMEEIKMPYKDYGLTGKTVKVKKKHSGDSSGEFWAYKEQTVEVIMETDCFLRIVALPHLHPEGLDTSKPYVTTIHKHDILIGEYLLNGGAIR